MRTPARVRATTGNTINQEELTMKVPAESLSGSSVRDKIVTAAEVVRLIRDGDSVVVEGFIGQGFA